MTTCPARSHLATHGVNACCLQYDSPIVASCFICAPVSTSSAGKVPCGVSKGPTDGRPGPLARARACGIAIRVLPRGEVWVAARVNDLPYFVIISSDSYKKKG